MSNEIMIPFSVNAGGSLSFVTDPDTQVRQHVMSLINTEPGERSVLSGYGIPLSDLLFEDAREVLDDLVADTQEAFTQWEPGVMLVSTSEDPTYAPEGLVLMRMFYQRKDSPQETLTAPANVNTVTIGPGGVKDEVIRG